MAEVIRVVVVGLDPGGLGKFGWCVGTTRPGQMLRITESGVVDNAASAFTAIQRVVAPQSRIAAAGIDCPLYWALSGPRQADITIRRELRRIKAPNIGGTVQDPNSLRGACLVQGVIAAHLLRRVYKRIRLTESHPKALLRFFGLAPAERPGTRVWAGELAKWVQCNLTTRTEDERDAIVAAFTAHAMMAKLSGWRNLVLEEGKIFHVLRPVEYWMPIRAVSGGDNPS